MKKIIFAIIFIILCFRIINSSQEKISRSIVNHMEAGNFINAEELDEHKVTMLHMFSKEVQVYSEKHRVLYFVVFEPYKGLMLHKNKHLILQNQSKVYPKYQSGGYIIFDIYSDNYINNRVDFYSYVTLNNQGFNKYNNNYFVGTYSSINELIVIKKSVQILSIIVLLGSIILYTIAYRKDKYAILLGLASLVMLIKFEAGIMLATLIVHAVSGKILKGRWKKYALILMAFICFVVSFEYFWLFCFVLFTLSLYNYYKDNTVKSFYSLITISLINIISIIDFEYSLFRLFYKEVFIIIIALFMLIGSILKLIALFSKENTIHLELLRGISHDFRLPISTIKLNTELIEKDDFDTDLNKGMILHIIDGAIRDLTHMTSSLTAYMSEDNYVNKKFKTSIQDSVEHTINYFKNNEKNIIIRTKLCDQELYLYIEDIWLNRLIYNLIDNAYKYSDEYGEITVSLKREKKKIVLSVKDNGIGMTKEQIDKVIEPFYRVDKSRSISGLGLGLSIIKSIVDNLEGSIKITSEPGVYTEFIIEI